MNERIKELIEQTGLIGSSGDAYHTSAAGMEKFAELIIHECAIAMSKIPGGYSAENYYKSNKSIKQHFGVDE